MRMISPVRDLKARPTAVPANAAAMDTSTTDVPMPAP